MNVQSSKRKDGVFQENQSARISRKRNTPCTIAIDSKIEFAAKSCFTEERICKYQSDNRGRKVTYALKLHFDEEWKELSNNERLAYYKTSSEEHVVDLKNEIIALKNETVVMKNEVVGMNNKIREVSTEVIGVNIELRRVRNKIEDLDTSINNLTVLVRQLTERLGLPKEKYGLDEDNVKNLKIKKENGKNGEQIFEGGDDFVAPHDDEFGETGTAYTQPDVNFRWYMSNKQVSRYFDESALFSSHSVEDLQKRKPVLAREVFVSQEVKNNKVGPPIIDLTASCSTGNTNEPVKLTREVRSEILNSKETTYEYLFSQTKDSEEYVVWTSMYGIKRSQIQQLLPNN